MKGLLGNLTLLLVSAQLTSAAPILGDLNGDGIVDFTDFFIFAANFGKRGDPVVPTETKRDTVFVVGVKYMNRFDDSSSVATWSKSSRGTWKVESGRLFLTGGTSSFIMSLSAAKIFNGDIDITVDAEWIKGVNDMMYGVYFRFGLTGGYGFAISGNGAYIIPKWFASGQSLEIKSLKNWTASNLIKQQGKNQLRVTTSSERLRFYINDTIVDQIADSDYKGGWVGLYVSDVQEIAFDNISVVETTTTQPLLLTKPVVQDYIQRH